jgi:hypothetical protein
VTVGTLLDPSEPMTRWLLLSSANFCKELRKTHNILLRCIGYAVNTSYLSTFVTVSCQDGMAYRRSLLKSVKLLVYRYLSFRRLRPSTIDFLYNYRMLLVIRSFETSKWFSEVTNVSETTPHKSRTRRKLYGVTQRKSFPPELPDQVSAFTIISTAIPQNGEETSLERKHAFDYVVIHRDSISSMRMNKGCCVELSTLSH